MNMNLKSVVLTCLITAIGTGCAAQSQTEADFGKAVRSVTVSQYHDPLAAMYPNEDPVTGGDTYRLENVVNSYRIEGAQPSSGGSTSAPGTSSRN